MDIVGMLVRIQPCDLHGGLPRCFHNFGGQYQVVRTLFSDSILLKHVRSGAYGVARWSEMRSDVS